jgi:hypothetical protein
LAVRVKNLGKGQDKIGALLQRHCSGHPIMLSE